MKCLNLVYSDKSEIKFKINSYPDGQKNITIDKNFLNGYTTKDNPIYDHLGKLSIVQIKARINNFQDLELIICATKSLRNLGVKEIHLYTPYFLGARSDRQFEVGSNRYLADVICPIINSLNFESVTVLDAHSNVLGNLLNNFNNLSNINLVQFAFNNIYNFISGETAYINQDKYILISPDAGASHKIYKLAEQINYNRDIITCSKERDTDGKLTKCVVPFKDEPNKDFIIIDDICDGGATFINIAKELKNNIIDRYKGKGKIYLIVTHGIFSKGFDELSQYFNGIYCTNSYIDLKDKEFTFKDKIKQLNVF